MAKYITHYAVKLYLGEGTSFKVLFSDGVTKRYDILWLAGKYPQLNALKNRRLFLKGHLSGWDGVEWNDELDIDADSVYECGDTVPNEDDYLTLLVGFFLKEARVSLSLTQDEAARKIGINQGDLSRIEKGLANPSLQTIEKILKGLNKKLLVKIAK